MNQSTTIQERVVKIVTTEELLAILKNLKGMPFSGVTLRTEVSLSKKAVKELGGKIIKTARYVFSTNRGYSRAVKLEMARQGIDSSAWVSQPLYEGSYHVSDSVIYYPKLDQHYAQFIFNKNSALTQTYTIEGREVSKESISQYLPRKTDSLKQKLMGMESTIKTICPKIENVIELNVDGISYRVPQ
jgi:hypothetical protein